MRIGLTGNYASGKGTICEMFAKLGATIIDTDILARELVIPNSKGLDELIKAFGKNYLNNDGTLNRRKLAQYIFQKKRRVKKLNKLLHPLILKKTLQLTPQSKKIIYIINTPLLFETKFYKYMDYTITIKTHKEQLYERGKRRDKISNNEIKQRLNYQFSLKKKLKKTDYIIDNSNSLENTKKQVLKLWKILTI